MCYGLAHNTMPPLANLSSILIHSVSIGRNVYTTHPVNQTISVPLVLLVNIAVYASLEYHLALEECLAISPCGDDISITGFPSAYLHPLNFIKEKIHYKQS